MKSKILIFSLIFTTLIPFMSFAQMQRVTDHVEPIIKTDYIKATSFTATSTTASSTFAGAIGIGTTSPYAALSVNGRGVFNQDVRADYFTSTSTIATSTLPILRMGEIVTRHSDGSITSLIATTSSDIGRGTALLTAFSNASNGDTIFLASSTYDIQTGQLDQSLGISIHGSGKYNTIITGTIQSTSGYIIKTGSNTETSDLSIIGTLPSSISSVKNQLLWGNSANVSSTTMRNVYLRGNSGYISLTGDNTVKLINISAYSISANINLNMSGTLDIFDSDFHISSGGESNLAQNILKLGTATINIYNSLFEVGGAVTSNTGITSFAGTTNLNGGKITSSGTSPKDIFVVAGTFNVTSNTVYDPTKTLGTITYIDNPQLRYSIGSNGASSTILVNQNTIANWQNKLNNFTIDYASTTALTVSGEGYFDTASTTNLFISALTSGRVPYITTAGQLTDSSNLTFNGTTLTANALSVGSLSGLLWGTNGAVSAISTSSLNLTIPLASTTGTLTVAKGGTGVTTFDQGLLYSSGGTGALAATNGPTVNYITATSITDISSFAGSILQGNTTIESVDSTGHPDWGDYISSRIVTSNPELYFSQTGDYYGTTWMRLGDHTTLNGVEFGESGVGVTDFNFVNDNTSAGGQIRMETRGCFYSSCISAPEFQIGAVNYDPTLDIPLDGSSRANFSGRVGIQNNNPLYALDVIGNVNIASGGAIRLGGAIALQSTTTATSTLQGFLNVLGTNSTSTFSGGLSANTVKSNYFVATSTTIASTFPYASTTAITSTQGDIGFPSVSMSSTQDQTCTLANTAYPITLNTNDVTPFAITHSTSTNNATTTIQYAGRYEITVSPIIQTTVASKHFSIWLNVDNQDIANTATLMEPPVSSQALTTVSLLYDFTAGQSFQLRMASDNAGAFLDATTAGSIITPSPASPSVIVTVKKISK